VENGCSTNGILEKKGYLKIHVAVDIKKEKRILSLEVTSEEVHDDGKMLL
jgi:hypothetical protein